MELTNNDVEQALANLIAAQNAICTLFDTGLENLCVFDHTGYTWGETGDSVFLTIDDCEWYDEIRVKEEFQIGDYTLLYATEDVFNAANKDKWNNMSLYLVTTNCGV